MNIIASPLLFNVVILVIILDINQSYKFYLDGLQNFNQHSFVVSSFFLPRNLYAVNLLSVIVK